MKKGGSIKMWRELFSQESRIFGVDIDPAIPSFPMDANIKTMVLDSSRTLDLVQSCCPPRRFRQRRRLCTLQWPFRCLPSSCLA